jgi:hypothetical protein
MVRKKQDEIEEKLRELEISLKESTNSNVPAAIPKPTGLSKGKEKEKEKEKKKSKDEDVDTVQISTRDSAREKSQAGSSSFMGDLFLLGGVALLILGVFVLFTHLTVFTGLPTIFGGFWGGGTGAGGLILLLLIGLGFFFYDYKNKIGWLLVACSLGALVYSLFTSMRLMLQPMNLLDLIFLFAPWLIGIVLLLKGFKKQNDARQARISHDK